MEFNIFTSNLEYVAVGYLIYHPAREITNIGELRVYHDSFGGNQDPYIWNKQFLHSFCHITQLPNKGKRDNNHEQINFWVSGDTYPDFTQLFCDCVFVIDEKHYWTEANRIDRSDSIFDNAQAYEHHYKPYLKSIKTLFSPTVIGHSPNKVPLLDNILIFL